jgi:ABC-type branched-subunit amino acid transport system ATPase component
MGACSDHRGVASGRSAGLARGEVEERVRGDSETTRSVTAFESGLVVRDLSVRFGGLQAVRNIGLCVPQGAITGLIGPNGAGKTTTFNACNGLVVPAGGEVILAGRRIERLSPAMRARAGLGRTFQHPQMFQSFTVLENVALGCEGRLVGGRGVRQIWASRSERREIEIRAAATVERCGLIDVANRPVKVLPTGLRRLVELARVVVGEFKVLLLDEPSSGLTPTETERFANLLLSLIKETSCGILLVEHDMSLVMQVCTYIYVMDFGEVIFEGTPEAVVSSAAVQSAYLGSTAQWDKPNGTIAERP